MDRTKVLINFSLEKLRSALATNNGILMSLKHAQKSDALRGCLVRLMDAPALLVLIIKNKLGSTQVPKFGRLLVKIDSFASSP